MYLGAPNGIYVLKRSTERHIGPKESIERHIGGGLERHFRAKNRALNGISGQNGVLNGISGQNRALNGISGQKSKESIVGDDSRFFALLGSAPQELNTVRPEAKLT
jgi:hypothetical protein